MNDARFTVLADRLSNLSPEDHAALQLVRAEIVELKHLLEGLLQRELADFLGAADSMVRSIGVLEGEAFEQVKDLVGTLVSVVAEAVAGMAPAPAAEPSPALPTGPEARDGSSAAEPSTAEGGVSEGLDLDLPDVPDTAAAGRKSLSLEGETPSSTHAGIRTMSELLLGQILIDSEKITRPQLVAALKLQAQESMRIGEALIRLGFVGEDEVEAGLEQQQELVDGHSVGPKLKRSSLLNELTLGEILTRVGGVTQQDLERALQVQRATGKRLGEALVELGAVTWARIEEAARIQARSRSQSAWGSTADGLSVRLDD